MSFQDDFTLAENSEQEHFEKDIGGRWPFGIGDFLRRLLLRKNLGLSELKLNFLT